MFSEWQVAGLVLCLATFQPMLLPSWAGFLSTAPSILAPWASALGSHMTGSHCAQLALAGIRQPARLRTPMSAALEAGRSEGRPEVLCWRLLEA